ncbi:hypothetical protein ASF41_12580 [Methylobacterium sp. Leaf111]|nr:hypothetical protein ASF41_12580 [Methylobacterium sp. Leaf111]
MDVVDPAQLTRIEAVHRGFLFQHLYAARSLLLVPGSNVTRLVVESDEDVEIVRAHHHTYVQVKSRIGKLDGGDVRDALDRFANYRASHADGSRPGSCNFVLASNAAPTPSLARRLCSAEWPADVRIDWPGGPVPADPVTPPPASDLAGALEACKDLASRLPFAALAPETLVWKLAGLVTAASSGTAPRTEHAFRAEELVDLFEQLVLQLQDFPAPPAMYRAQAGEPPLRTESRVRLVVGWSGAGKTAWVAQSSLHSTHEAAYLDIRDVPSTAISSTIARDLAARLHGASGELGRILLPGASGLEILRALDRRRAAEGRELVVVMDNVHGPVPADVAAVVGGAPGMSFVLLTHPGPAAQELAARLRITPEVLGGWTPDMIAAEVSSCGCRADAAACQALMELTGGLPLYVQNAVAIAAAEHDGDLSALCAAIASSTHSTATAQELILAQAIHRLDADARHVLGVLSLCDVPLARGELIEALDEILGAPPSVVASYLRSLRTAGMLEAFGNDRLKVHDAIRLPGRSCLAELGEEARLAAMRSLRGVLKRSMERAWEYPKLRLFLRVLAETDEIDLLIQFGTDEVFHELGLWPEIEGWLFAAAKFHQDPGARFWAMDAIAFHAMRVESPDVSTRLDAMRALVNAHGLGADERLALGMKEMNLLARHGRKVDVLRILDETAATLHESPPHQRIFRYNAAVAFFHLGEHDRAARDAISIADEYFRHLGIDPSSVMGRNPADLYAILRKSDDLIDDCKHLADCLDLFATAANANGRASGNARVHALKFYQLAQSPESLVRVGQDLVDEFVERQDFTGARRVMEDSIFPIIRDLKLAAYVVPVRAQYAVVLAYCGAFDAAESEMSRLMHYESGMDASGRAVLADQRRLIAHLRRAGRLR